MLKWLTLSCRQEVLVQVSIRFFRNWLGHPSRRRGAEELQTLSLGTERASGRSKDRMLKYSGYVHQRQPPCASVTQFLNVILP